eukprot:5891212-Pleurochrysis_carterae.AAC.1
MRARLVGVSSFAAFCAALVTAFCAACSLVTRGVGVIEGIVVGGGGWLARVRLDPRLEKGPPPSRPSQGGGTGRAC